MTAMNAAQGGAPKVPGGALFQQLNESELNSLARMEGPCVTIQVPAFRPGASGDTRRTLLRQLTQTAADKLRDFDPSDRASALMGDLDRLAGEEQVLAGGPGLTLCAAPGFASVMLTPGVHERVNVGSRFYLLPLVSVSALPPEVYALGVNKNHIRLWRVHLKRAGGNGNVEELALPPGVPASVMEAGAFDPPDHDLENRSSAGPSVGGMRVRFGTSAERGDTYLHKFFKLVAEGLQPVINNAPVMLIGVREDLAEYRRVAHRGDLLETEWHDASEYISDPDVAIHAHDAALQRNRARGEALLKALPEAPHRILGDVEAITAAARQGRIHRLLTAEDAAIAPEINVAVVEALRTGAEVLALPGETLPGCGVLGAMLRY